ELAVRSRRGEARAVRDRRVRNAEERALRIVCRAGDAVDAHVGDRERHRVGTGRTIRLEDAGLVADAEIDEPDARADALGDLLLDVDRGLRRRGLLEVRIDTDRAFERAGGQRAFFTGLVGL